MQGERGCAGIYGGAEQVRPLVEMVVVVVVCVSVWVGLGVGGRLNVGFQPPMVIWGGGESGLYI